MSSFSVPPAVIMFCQFSLMQTGGHRYHDSPLPETSSYGKLHEFWSVDFQQSQ